MRLSEAQRRKAACTTAWSTEQELIITTLQQAESVPRAEAIRRMQRRRKASLFAIDRAWYATRLDDPWLLDFSIPLRTRDACFFLAVPVGGRRRGGLVPFDSPKSAEQAAERLRGTAGFPNVRIERSRKRGSHHLIRWGEEQPTVTERDNQVEGKIAEHRSAGEFFGYSDSAIRAFLFEQFGRDAVLAAERLCRNLRCTRGDDGGPRSLAHLRADALYCNDACRKGAERSPKRENQTPNRLYLCGSKPDNLGSLADPYYADEHAS